MTSPRFHCPVPLVVGATIELPENVARHAARVLRLHAGDGMVLFDGNGGEYNARIAAVGRDQATAEVLDRQEVEREAPISVTLVQALQSGDKMDLTIQKAVELGAIGVIPVASRRSVLRLDGARALKRVEHWRGVAVAACEQCGRNRVPVIADLETLDRWLDRPAAANVLRVMLAPGASLTLATLPRPAADVRIELLIGAEGGLAPEELEKAARAGFIAIRLGPRILRTETAGLAALSAMQCLWGDFSEGESHV